MIILASFPQQSPANTLVAYMQANNIACSYQAAEQQFQVILHNDADLDAAKQMLLEFVQNPNAKKFQSFAWQNATPAELGAGSVGFSWRNGTAALFKSPLAAAILLIALVIHGLVFVFGQFELFDHLYFQPWSEVVQNGEIWRLITPTLMHFSALHIIFNLVWWWILGLDIEQKLGLGMLLAIYLTTGIISNLAQFWVSGPNFGGLSGVVYGLFGFVWWMGWLRPDKGLSLSKPLIGFMLLWLVIGYADVLWINMANTAHLTGLISGCVLALFYASLHRKPLNG